MASETIPWSTKDRSPPGQQLIVNRVLSEMGMVAVHSATGRPRAVISIGR